MSFNSAWPCDLLEHDILRGPLQKPTERGRLDLRWSDAVTSRLPWCHQELHMASSPPHTHTHIHTHYTVSFDCWYCPRHHEKSASVYVDGTTWLPWCPPHCWLHLVSMGENWHTQAHTNTHTHIYTHILSYTHNTLTHTTHVAKHRHHTLTHTRCACFSHTRTGFKISLLNRWSCHTKAPEQAVTTHAGGTQGGHM